MERERERGCGDVVVVVVDLELRDACCCVHGKFRQVGFASHSHIDGNALNYEGPYNGLNIVFLGMNPSNLY